MRQKTVFANKVKIDLFSAPTYRDYLNEIVALERNQVNGASLRTIADRLGIGLSTFKMVLDGSRDLTIKNIFSIATKLNLVKHEHEFFESMVFRDQAVDDDVRAHYDKKLQQFRIENKNKRVRISSSTVMQCWYAPAFLIYLLDVAKVETLGINDASLERASNVFGVPTKTLRVLFDQMKEAGIIVGANDGKYHIVFERISGKFMKERYLKGVFLECINRISREFENPDAMFSAHTVSMSKPLIREFYNEYKTLIERYMSYDNTGCDLEILQICTQAVPLLLK